MLIPVTIQYPEVETGESFESILRISLASALLRHSDDMGAEYSAYVELANGRPAWAVCPSCLTRCRNLYECQAVR